MANEMIRFIIPSYATYCISNDANCFIYKIKFRLLQANCWSDSCVTCSAQRAQRYKAYIFCIRRRRQISSWGKRISSWSKRTLESLGCIECFNAHECIFQRFSLPVCHFQSTALYSDTLTVFGCYCQRCEAIVLPWIINAISYRAPRIQFHWMGWIGALFQCFTLRWKNAAWFGELLEIVIVSALFSPILRFSSTFPIFTSSEVCFSTSCGSCSTCSTEDLKTTTFTFYFCLFPNLV